MGCQAGVEVKPGEHFTPSGDEDSEYDGCRLHLSQATLGLDVKGKERTVVKCKVGDGPELLLCSLTPGVSDSCSLDLLFDQDVVFSVAGSTSVHLVGYYMPLDDDEEEDNDYEFEGSEFDSEEDLDDEDYDEDSDMDGIDDAPPSSVTITELDDDATLEKTPVQNKQISDFDEGDQNKVTTKKRKRAVSSKENRKESSKEVDSVTVGEASEDEDGFPRPSEKTEAVNRSEGVSNSSTSSDEAKKQKKKKKKKKKTKDKNEKLPTQVEETERTPERAEEVAKTPKTAKTAAKENSSEVKSSTKTSAANGSTATPGTDAIGKKVKKPGFSIRKFPNGLEIEEIAIGRPDARQTKPGKRVKRLPYSTDNVTVNYTGRLKSNGKIFDSSIGKKPFVFRLGVGEVVKGWDVGVAGMRIGDKRRITIPPAMGYGAKGSGPVPGNSWLVFDVEVVDVAK